MKLTTIALASAFALSSTVALANAVHKSKARHSMARMPSNGGNPNGTAGGPTTLSGTGNSQYGGSSPGTSGKN